MVGDKASEKLDAKFWLLMAAAIATTLFTGVYVF